MLVHLQCTEACRVLCYSTTKSQTVPEPAFNNKLAQASKTLLVESIWLQVHDSQPPELATTSTRGTTLVTHMCFNTFYTHADKAVREAWQLANSPAWRGLFEAQREGVWCDDDPRQEALSRHVQALVHWKALPPDCLASINQLFLIPPVRLLLAH